MLSGVRAWTAVALALAVAAGAAGCGGAVEREPEAPPPSRLVGTILEVREEDGRVVSFTLEARGRRWEIGIADDVDYGFDLAHLHEHRDTGDPVDVRLERREDRLVALRIDDA